ncbi:S8 family peptidase [Bacillus thuringiensis]|uniref:S8 family peptidase n=1 Tax=Bacillus thuringiensis TaxID=1428 RepID=UPI0020C344C3|nr:S8 family serine peptidase [Bacillus thuringiensis]
MVLKGILDPTLNEFNWNYKKILLNKEPYHLKDTVTIGIIDSGIDITNPYLKDKIVQGRSFVSSAYTKDDTGHGTQIFGILDNLIKGANYKFYKVMDNEITNSLNLVKAIIAAVDDGVDIINISLGIYKNSQTESDQIIINSFKKAINYARNNNVLIVASAGNNGLNMDEYPHIIHLPSDLEYVINVGSSDKHNDLTSYTNHGKNVNIIAPSGEWIAKDDKILFSEMIITYGKESSFLKNNPNYNGIPKGLVLSYGTSLAPPQVAAAFAVVIDKYKNLSIDEYKSIVFENSSEISHNTTKYKEIRIVY